VKTGKLYEVWELTAKEMCARVKADPSLRDRLEQSPFSTRADAEKHADGLNTQSSSRKR